MKTIFSVLTLFIIFLEACTKCNSTTDYLTAQQKAFANFKPGSYWIMKDSASGVIDTFIIIRNQTRFFTKTPDVRCSDTYQNILIELINNDSTNIFLNATAGKNIMELWIDNIGNSGLYDLNKKHVYQQDGILYNDAFLSDESFVINTNDSFKVLSVISLERLFVKLNIHSNLVSSNKNWNVMKYYIEN